MPDTPSRFLAKFRLPAPPSPRLETALWFLLLALAVGLRVYVANRLPVYIWTRDSGSYVDPALDWLETGRWVTNPRRGPIYSLFIASILRAGGSLLTVVTWQAVLGCLTAALTAAAARCWLGRAAAWPLLLGALFYVLHPLGIELERLIRNETLLVFFCTVAFGAWSFAIRREPDDGAPAPVGWMLLSGLSAGLMQLLKGIFVLFPPLVLVLTLWHWRRRPALAALLAVCFVLPFVAPLAASKLYNRLSGTGRPSEPEDGIMLYGRTAQWTVLDGGLEPAVKAQVRGQVEAYASRYRKTGKLENNEIVKRTVVPSLKRILEKERPGFKPTDLNKFCYRLAFEAIRAHPAKYAGQVLHDLYFLNFVTAHHYDTFKKKQLSSGAKDARLYYDQGSPALAQAFDIARTETILHAAAAHSPLRGYGRWMILFRRPYLVSPALLTTLLLPFLAWRTRRGERLCWLGLTALWFYYLVLLSTVGRPLDRYLLPVAPVMFWTITAAMALGWRQAQAWLEKRANAVLAPQASSNPGRDERPARP